jgi:PadR family transcriptional regulator PadR
MSVLATGGGIVHYSVILCSGTRYYAVPEGPKRTAMDDLTEMLKGTLEGCVLEVIGSEETYGYAITRRLNELGFADVIEGTVYTILLRLERSGLVQVTKRPSGMGPPRKFYALNDAGREELATFWAKWEYLSSRIDKLKEGGR